MHAAGRHCYVLDGDNVRFGLNRDLGSSKADRTENIRRVAEVARLFNDAGSIVLVPVISPFREDREAARRILGEDRFFEIYVSTPIEACEARDAKGLYQKARAGQIAEFTGISSPYEPPLSPGLVLDTSGQTIAESADAVWRAVEHHLRPR
jgi:adenylyl-sulfate kinase